MSFAQEWEAFKTPPRKEVKPAPEVGAKAPVHPNLLLPTDRPTIIAFLRHCGCPFAEKTFKALTKLSNHHKDINFVAISHSSSEATERWVVSVGGNWDVNVVIDEERDLYALFGLGGKVPLSSWSSWLEDEAAAEVVAATGPSQCLFICQFQLRF
ncbi:hypothetical protein NUW58_g5134 [Xylaria curta]|uniref:Uncharacterized protein n=1 Tax=Xylaria curta TaxID=42375 RepID=A0ACC1P339_9PEZI|nr:hypothetical protein NUW58_g5134 [Xylaria curta]